MFIHNHTVVLRFFFLLILPFYKEILKFALNLVYRADKDIKMTTNGLIVFQNKLQKIKKHNFVLTVVFLAMLKKFQNKMNHIKLVAILISNELHLALNTKKNTNT